MNNAILDLYRNASGTLAIVVDDETLILASGRRLSFEAVGDRWDFEREATSDDLSPEQIGAVREICREVEEFEAADRRRVEARLAREAEAEAARRRPLSAADREMLREMSRIMLGFTRALNG